MSADAEFRDLGSGQSKGAREGDSHEPDSFRCQSAWSHLNRLEWELEGTQDS